MSEQHRVRVGITHGDWNGIGYEIIIKALADMRMCEMMTPIIYGSPKAIAHYRTGIEGAENFSPTLVQNSREARGKRVNIVNVCGDDIRIEPGVATKQAGEGAVTALKTAVADLKAGLIDVIVTAPINKENVQSDDFRFTGHTEFFAAQWGGEPLMIMCSELLKVGLVTMHIPLNEVAKSITKEKIVAKLVALRKSLIADFAIVEPRIAVLSLNPHCGDGGLLGTEEKDIITPAIEQARKQGIMAFGPLAADGLFASAGYKKYDAILAMYHDQGLAPFKALTPEGVNFTAALSGVRTSPDHGVAYDIAGQGVADESSMREALYAAVDIFRARANYKQFSTNPLRHYEREKGNDISVKDLLPEPKED